MVNLPLEFSFTFVRLWCIFGFTSIYVLLGITAVVYTNKIIQNYVHDRDDENLEEGKKREELGCVTHESFENIRAIKQYNWDDFFMGRILGLRQQIQNYEEDRRKYDYINHFMG